jgi:predicted PurR-regulated permease PerM
MNKKQITPPQPKSQLKVGAKPTLSARFFLITAFILIIIITAIYYKSLNNQLTNLDDDFYITNNAGITTLNIKSIFSSYVQGNYHPLTMLSYCLEYKYAQLNPKIYHTTNLVLHLLNTLLVFIFIWLLSKQQWVAFITALLFGIHPMHVESVAWVSERKDVLYSFFI